jgi:DNA polymerase III psi subunit
MDFEFQFFDDAIYKVGNLNEDLKKLLPNAEQASVLICLLEPISDDLRDFLHKILEAVKLNPKQEVCQLITSKHQLSWVNIEEQLKVDKVILFGMPASKIGLHLRLPAYQPFEWEGKSFLLAHQLKDIQTDPQKKRQLWGALQAMFLNK